MTPTVLRAEYKLLTRATVEGLQGLVHVCPLASSQATPPDSLCSSQLAFLPALDCI